MMSPQRDTPRQLISSRMNAIRFSGIRRSFDLAQRMSGVISLGLGEPDFETPPPIREAAKAALDAGVTHYTPNAGYRELREAIAEKLQRDNGIQVDPEHEVVVTVGAAEGIFLACQALISPGDEVILADPNFLNYEPCIRAAGGMPVFVPLDEARRFRLDPAAVARSITPRTRGLILNSPHNPTGAMATYEELEELAALAVEHDLFIISDEVYEKIVYPPARHYSIAAFPRMRDRTVTVQSFSKTYAMCGWRIGYVAGDRRILDEILKLQQFCGIHAPSFAQRAAETALKGSSMWVEEMVAEYARRRAYLVEAVNAIPGLSVAPPDGAFFLFANARAFGLPSEALADLLLADGQVAVVPGSALGPRGEGYLRLCFALPLEKLKEATEKMRGVLSQLEIHT